MRLLIVDDANAIRHQIARSVELANARAAVAYDIETAVDGLDAMRKFESFDPDGVTLDITMPEMDGLQCVSAVIRKKPVTKILVISALADRPSAVEAVKRGAQGFLLKPFSSDELHLELRELLREPRKKKR